MAMKIALFILSFTLHFASGWLLGNLFSEGYSLQDKTVFVAMSAGFTIAGISLHIQSQKNHS